MASSRLFEPLTVGNLELKHRLGLCPLTRYRASDDHVPTSMMAEYYAQRASTAGSLLVSEGTFVHEKDGGYANVPGIYNEKQVNKSQTPMILPPLNRRQVQAWRKVTDAVHAKGSYIFCQLWALGRTVNPKVASEEGITIVGSDTIPLNEGAPRPQRLTVEQIQGRIQNYAQAAKNAIEAGFDGVELHGANGYLIDQFIQDVSNQRDDQYGGSIEGRSRFAVEAVRAVCDAIGSEKVGLRLSPWSSFNSMRMSNPIPQFSNVIEQLSSLNMAYLHLVEPRISGNIDVESSDTLEFVYNLWKGPLLVAGGLTPASARKLVDEEHPDKNIVAMFGRSYISTPYDFPLTTLSDR